MKIVILDRDGVINLDSDDFIKNVHEWIPIDGSIQAIAKLFQAGYRIYVATNQSGLGRGLFSLDDLEAMHNKMRNLVREAGGDIAAIFFCPHTPDDNCACRKPLPGLLEQVRQHAGVELLDTPMIGDSLRDLEAGLAVGCRPVLVKTGKGIKTLQTITESALQILAQLQVYDSLAQAADALLEDNK